MKRFKLRLLALICVGISLACNHALGNENENDLLADDEVEFEYQETDQQPPSWIDGIRTTLQHSHRQGKHVEVERSEVRLEYEIAPWEGTYLRIDDKLSYFEHGDVLARTEGESYSHNKLQQAWIQFSRDQCVATIGRQNLFWGLVEGTFAVDVVSPFDYTEQLLTDYSNIRLSQDMLLSDCYLSMFSDINVQMFYLPSARLDTFRHRNKQTIDDLENSLHDEWGARISKSWSGMDVSLMYARLYGNAPVILVNPVLPGGVELRVPRHDFFGISTAWARGRLLTEFELAYKQGQLEAFSGHKQSEIEAALGFEYTTSSNHQFNSGVWVFDEMLREAGGKSSMAALWTAGWSKTYLNDDLTMSFLGSWLSKPEQASTTLQAQYQWNDNWSFSSALSYADLNDSVQTPLQTRSELTVLTTAKVQF